MISLFIYFLVTTKPTSINGSVIAQNNYLKWPYYQRLNLLLFFKITKSNKKVYRIHFRINQNSFPFIFQVNNLTKIQNDGQYSVSLLIFAFPHRLLWESDFLNIQIKANTVNQINFIVKNVCK